MKLERKKRKKLGLKPNNEPFLYFTFQTKVIMLETFTDSL